MSNRLTDEQETILKSTLQGHNLVITGQAGTGKSFLVTSLIKKLREAGKRVAVVCSSGLACTVYKRHVATTVHSAYGLGTASLPWQKVVQKAKCNTNVIQRLKSSDVLVWDEISMSSSRILELVNAIEIAIGEGRDSIRPFNGKQVLLVGDFWQLKPVPSVFDDGNYAFTSDIFCLAFQHRYELTRLMRQNNDELSFLRSLSEVRAGHCNQATLEHISSLSRSLEGNRLDLATHIFFLKLNASIHNLNVMRSMPGDFIVLNADINGQVPSTSVCPAEKALRLKIGCKVMLIWNLSDTLRNGSQGTFQGLDEHSNALVKFPIDGVVKISRRTWSQVDKNGSVVGTTTQYPLIASYAITCHKSQGQTLEAAIVHCSNEFVSGLTYVAMSRVKSENDIQVLNFKSKYLRSIPALVTEQEWSSQNNLQPDFSCCRERGLSEPRHWQASDRRVDENDETLVMDDNYETKMTEDVEYLKNVFESDDINISINLADVSKLLEEDTEISKLPDNIIARDILSSLISEDAPMGSNGHNKNLTIYEMLDDDALERKLVGFAKYIWHQLFKILEKYLDENADIAIPKVSRQEFTAITKELHAFLKSDNYKACLYDLFGVDATSITTIHTTIGSQLVLELYSRFLDVLAEKVRCQQAQEMNEFKVWDMSSDGKGKIRYVGGWSLRKVMEKARSYVKQNIVSENEHTLKQVNVCMDKLSLIQDELCVDIEAISSTSKYPDTLELTESRQYRTRGLLHTTDSTFEFFMALEQRRIEVINDAQMKKHGSSMIEKALNSLQVDEDLKEKWMLCFEDDLYLQELKECIFNEVVERIVNMGTNQFLRDYRYHYKVKKTMELRKRVFQKKQKEQEKKDILPFQDILKDTSNGKVQSHSLLRSFCDKHHHEGLVRVYRKNELQLLCKAYKIKFNSKCNKKTLATMLLDAINTQQQVPLVTALQ